MYSFVLLNFLVAFVSDLVLNGMSRSSYSPAAVQALRLYFGQKIFVPAVLAGVTVVTVLLFTMALSWLVFHFTAPKNTRQLGLFLLLAAPLGYLADILIYRGQVFGTSLNPFYKIAGAGFWGAAAFLVAIVVSYGVSAAAVAIATKN
jgi:hypothetical protein